jgi:predicted DNA-binding protein
MVPLKFGNGRCQTPDGKMANMKEYRLTVRVNAELRQRLSATAKRTGKRESAVVREALEAQLRPLQKKESVLDSLKRLGLVGIIKDGPKDLASNKKHFEGFGES